MHDPIWLDELRAQLERKRLPPAYAARLLDELSDHVTDLLEDQMSTDALESHSVFDRLGAPEDVARQAAAEYRRRNFCGRHPILMFVVLPVMAIPVAYFLGMMTAIGVGWLWKSSHPGLTSDQMSPLGIAGLRLLCTVAQVAPVAAVAAFFGWLAARSGVNRKWPIVMCVTLGLIVAVSHFDMYLSPLPSKSAISIGFGYYGWRRWFVQLARFGAPVLVGMSIFARRLRVGRPELAR
jgi:hypothetical protein